MRHYNTIIVGGGVSGMACARQLRDHGKEFLLVTKDLGGRMRTTADKVNFGASYVTTDYEHVLQYADKGLRLLLHDCHCHRIAERVLQRTRKRLRLPIQDCYFSGKAGNTNLFTLKNVRHVLQLITLYFMVKRFRRRLNRLRRRALNEEQAVLLRKDPLLLRYARQSLRDFIAEHGFKEIHEKYFYSLARSTSFCSYRDMNAFAYLQTLMPFILPTYTADFRQTVRRLTRGMKRRIKYARVKSVRRGERGFRIMTSAGAYTADTVVLAAPHSDLHSVYPVPKPHKQASIYVINVSGKRKPAYDGKRIVFFGPPHKITILWKQENGTEIIFSTVKQPRLSKYYERFRTLKSVYWKTAVVISDCHWTKQDLGKGLYLASDYNISGLEDSFITGVYAANRIIERTS